ncbi:CZB domain-containing protein [Accumulibacter sp.]|uniref:CZB domain-containing protein n=1 Tax=Accumulibacter sp. TaxID=2053492 RepID=UPI0025DF9328|nr:CZB domain-containing protein [Accumulibacter sp.]MCM8611339.1 CZB domain-containing protein [Accumulibacter sp.]MCM8635014.1 CZB domain-containing protein [Accumulibacter sp.]MCM8639802.1 CZB domain-containing protein [Accumulibacter sp.]
MDRVRDIEEAIGAHARWMSELRQAVLDATAGVDVEAIRADDRCDFGQWLYGPRLSAEDRAAEDFDEVRRLHAEFHQMAAEVVERAMAGQTVEAYALLYGEYVTLSGRLALAMRAWQARLLRGIAGDA